MAYDLLIKNGTVVDGTGAPRVQADVAIVNGKIAEVGKIKDGAAKTIDAGGLIVAPGFIDPHTHYDAQIWWDDLVTCSSWHGVTTTVMGNCGVGIAPCKPEMREIAAWDLVNVEGIPFDVLKRGITWKWETFPQYIDAAAQHKLGINVGFLAPLTPFRHYIMGEESMDRAARPEEIKQIRQLIHGAIAAGALGWSTSKAANHVGYQGRPLASRLASMEELVAYASVLKELGRGVIEFNLNVTGNFGDEDYKMLDALLTASGRPVTWLAVFVHNHKETLARVEPLVKRGGIPQVSAVPVVRNVDLRTPGSFAALPAFKRVLNKPIEVMKKEYADPAFRDEFRTNMSLRVARPDLKRMRVEEVQKPELKSYEGKPLTQIAQERGVDLVDAFLDLAVADDIQTRFTDMPMSEDGMDSLLSDPRTMVGLSDGGAHVDAHCEAGYPTYMIGHWVRKKQLFSLERAVQLMTSNPADIFGVVGRGRLTPGMAADVVIFDLDKIDTKMRQHQIRDLPGGGARFVMTAQGINYTVVNGEVIYVDGRHTGALPGQVVRSQRMQ
ncbi:MAG TPA: amidohydrolase family protein [Candidatus Binataceae bacterium]|nr:amidohydrolase family protein [Candidatus Binataceae bacterium]